MSQTYFAAPPATPSSKLLHLEDSCDGAGGGVVVGDKTAQACSGRNGELTFSSREAPWAPSVLGVTYFMW